MKIHGYKLKVNALQNKRIHELLEQELNVNDVGYPYIYLHKTCVGYGLSDFFFINHYFKEISADELIKMLSE